MIDLIKKMVDSLLIFVFIMKCSVLHVQIKEGSIMGFVKRNAGRWPNGVIPFTLGGSYDPLNPGSVARAINAVPFAQSEYSTRTCIEIKAITDKKVPTFACS
jgi:hypothetical protein